jgi:hypothetical protein
MINTNAFSFSGYHKTKPATKIGAEIKMQNENQNRKSEKSNGKQKRKRRGKW